MKAVIAPKTKTYLHCPECASASHKWGHLSPGQSFGPWYCDDCGFGIKGEATHDGANIEACSDRQLNTLVLLRLQQPLKGGKNVHIVVKGMAFVKEGESPNFERDEYLYNEHICPWNYLQLSLKVGEDVDPIGSFVYQETVLMPDGYDEAESLCDQEAWKAIFPSLRDEDYA